MEEWVNYVKIVAADSSTAILNDKFDPISIVAVAATLVNPPYREPSSSLAEKALLSVENAHEAVVYEAELCRKLLERVDADIVHLDMSLGAIPLEQLSPIQFSNMRISSRAKRHLLKILPRLRKISGEITQKYGVEVLAIGKESIPVRIAELTAGAHAILYACQKAIEESKTLLLGLPSKCQLELKARERVYLRSLIGAEHDVRGWAADVEGIVEKVNIVEMLNPRARGFRVLRIHPEKGE